MPFQPARNASGMENPNEASPDPGAFWQPWMSGKSIGTPTGLWPRLGLGLSSVGNEALGELRLVHPTHKIDKETTLSSIMTYSIPFSLTNFIAEASAAVATKTIAHEKEDALEELLMKFSCENRFESAKKMFDKTTDANSLSYHMLHCDTELSVVYAQLPPKFQSAAFDHATECVTMTLQGIEGNTFYEEQPDASLKRVHHENVAMGQALRFPKDCIRSVENKSAKVSIKVLMCFLGDLRKHNEMRHVYDLSSNTKVPFSFDSVVEYGLKRMEANENVKSVATVETAAPETAQLMQ